MNYIALGNGGKVSLLAEVESRLDDGTILFEVVNGGWRGSFRGGLISIRGDARNTLSAALLWEGEWPDGEAGYDYNTAIDWINQELAR